MSTRNSTAVPDAWDDDWESVADKEVSEPQLSSEQPSQDRKAERKAKHVEANKELWKSAESTPERFLFLEAKDTVPLKSEYKPPVKVLSRKPKSNGTAPRDGQSGTAGSSAAFDDDDSEAEATRRNELSLAERQQKAQREREEKQRKYIEVRERLFGTSTPDNGSQSVTPKAAPNSGARPTREKGKPKGSRDSRPASSSEPSPARGKGQSRQLFDPSYSPKPATSNVQKSADGSLQTTSETSNPDQPIRMPRGPDGSGRGGFGFSQRGNKASTGFGD